MRTLALLLLLQSINPGDLSQITAALREKHFDTALRLTQELLDRGERDPRVWTLQGFAHLGLTNQLEALKDFRQAISLAPTYLPALKAEAQIEYSQNDGKAVETLQRIVALEPGDQTSHAMLAALAYQRHDCHSVIANYSLAEPFINSQTPALAEYGQCLFANGQKEKAVPVFARAVAANPVSWQERYNLAVADLSLDRTAEALAAVEPLLQSNQAQVLDVASSAYERLGNTPKAVEVLRQAIVLNPTATKLYLHFADLSFNHNSFQVGIDMLNAGLRKMPNSSQLYLARGILFVQLGDYAKAETDFTKAAQLDPFQSSSSVAEGLAQLQQSNLDGALAITREQLKQNPKDDYLWYLEAETLRQRGVEPGTPDFAEAVNAAETAVRLKPNFPLANDLLGSLYLREGKIAAAVKQFEMVLKEEPENESALYHLIVASKKDGRSEALPGLMKRLAEAKSLNKEKDQRLSRYTFVEPDRKQER